MGQHWRDIIKELRLRVARLEDVIQGELQETKDCLEDCDPDPSPRNGTRQVLQNKVDYLERILNER